MNCECIYYIKDASVEQYEAFANKIESLTEELYPVAISRLTEDIECTRDYDHMTSLERLKRDQLVLFVGGKLHYMDSFAGAKALFPYDPGNDWFEDIKMY